MSTRTSPPLDPRHGKLQCKVYEVNSRTGLCRWCDGPVATHAVDTFKDVDDADDRPSA